MSSSPGRKLAARFYLFSVPSTSGLSRLHPRTIQCCQRSFSAPLTTSSCMEAPNSVAQEAWDIRDLFDWTLVSRRVLCFHGKLINHSELVSPASSACTTDFSFLNLPIKRGAYLHFSRVCKLHRVSRAHNIDNSKDYRVEHWYNLWLLTLSCNFLPAPSPAVYHNQELYVQDEPI